MRVLKKREVRSTIFHLQRSERQDMSTNAVIKRENTIIASVLFNTECKQRAISKEIKDDLFQTPENKKIMAAFNAIANVGMEPTESLIIDQLLIRSKDRHDEEKIKKEKLVLSAAFQQLKEQVPPENPDAIELHLKVLRQSFTLKRYVQIAEEIIKRAKKHDMIDPLSEDIKKLEHYIENAFYEMEGVGGEHEIKVMSLIEGMHCAIQNMRKALTQEGNEERVSMGYPEIDDAFAGGVMKGTYVIIAARPAMGKTVFMLNAAIESAKKGAKVLFISIEMNLLQCFQRVVSKVSGVSSGKIQQPKTMTSEEWDMLQTSVSEVADVYGENMWIEEVLELTPAQLERKIKQYKKLHKIDMVYVDYAQIMLTKEGNEPKEQSDFAQISSALRRVSKAQHVGIVVGSQLSRDNEKRPDKRPMLSDIRNSGAFEQDAAQVIGLYRDEVYNKEESISPNILEVIILKNRFGKGAITIEFNYDLDKQSIFSKAS